MACQDDKVIGYLAASYASYAYRAANPIGEIENMYVDSAARRHGAGKQLIAAFRTWCAQNNVVRARVGAFAANDKALAFYHDAGFTDSDLHLEMKIT